MAGRRHDGPHRRLTSPYLTSDGSDGGSGQLAFGDDELAALILDAHRAGWQLAIHAIGDAAVDQAIAVVTAAQAAHPRPGARHRVEHCGLVRPEQLPRWRRPA